MIYLILPWVLYLFPTDSVGVVTHVDFQVTGGFHPSPADHPVDLGIAESYLPNWTAHRLDPEAARRWEDLPPLAAMVLSARFDSVRMIANLPLRRDIDAWRRDPTGSNLLLAPGELDINVPYEGWISWSSTGGTNLKLGRFRQSFSPSPYGVILGSDLVHDGALVQVPMGRWSFEVFFSSLNPWLTGVHADGSVDPGSEADLQRTRTIPNERGRNYSDPYKSLFLHKLSCQVGAWDLSLVEQLLVGGKAPQLRDAVPFVMWHNNFGDGYSKVSTAVQAIWTSQSLGRFHGQGIFEDIQSPVGEVEGSDPRVIYAANLGWRLDKKCPSGDWTATSDLSLTSATFNNHELPLLKGTSRRLYRSNNRDQDAPGFVDTWIVDQPLGYLRGSDALDLWTHLDWSATDHSHGAGVELDWLNQGDAAVWMDEDTLSHRKGPLSGKVTTQWRALGHGWTKVTKSLRLDGGLGVVVVDAPEGEEQTLTLHPDVFGSLSVGF